MSSAEEPRRPTLRVIRGDATAEEIAALLAVVAARSGGIVSGSGDGTASAWTDRASLMRHPPAPGPGSWRASGWAN